MIYMDEEHNNVHGRKVLKYLVEEQSGRCALCGGLMPPIGDVCDPADKPNIDHKIPRSKGGPDYVWNLQATHSRCNEAKGDTMPEVGPRSPHTASIRSVVNEAGLAPKNDNLTSFPPLTDQEAEDYKEMMRIDTASIYAT